MLAAVNRYFRVAKPGIILANLISTAGGFFLASRGRGDLPLLAATLIGTMLVVASACVLNNCIDRDIDRKMSRTRNRVLARGRMSPMAAIVYAALLGVAGAALLMTRVNGISLAVVLVGFVVYVGFYSLVLKRRSVNAAVIGSLAGAAPPVAGYCAVSNRFDMGAVLLVFIFGLWQIPHAYAIAVMRGEDYAAADIPVITIRRCTSAAKKHIVAYILAFLAAALMLSLAGYTGRTYMAAAATVGLLWLILAVHGFRTSDERLWAKRVFVFSILAIAVLSVMMSVDAVRSVDTATWLTSIP